MVSYTLYVLLDCVVHISRRGHTVVQRLRHCVTNRKVAGSIPNGVAEIFH
jgi:hypothetical protein